MTRAEALEQFLVDHHGYRLLKKLTPSDLDMVEQFIEKHETLEHPEFDYAVNRMFLDGAEKPKAWTVIMEILSCVNTRAKGVERQGFKRRNTE